MKITVQVDGKNRGEIEFADLDNLDALEVIRQARLSLGGLSGGSCRGPELRGHVYVPGRLVNFLTKEPNKEPSTVPEEILPPHNKLVPVTLPVRVAVEPVEEYAVPYKYRRWAKFRASLVCGCGGYECDPLEGYGATEDEAVEHLRVQVEAGYEPVHRTDDGVRA